VEGIGLLANALEGVSEPDWLQAYNSSVVGDAICSPVRSTLMSAVGVLIAGKLSAGIGLVQPFALLGSLPYIWVVR
jgi:hypothetical protein